MGRLLHHGGGRLIGLVATAHGRHDGGGHRPGGGRLHLHCPLTGAAWGSNPWGTWWVWDARLTSELILLFLYLGVIALYNAFSDKVVAMRRRHPGAGRG